MQLFRNRLVFGIIKRIIVTALKAVYVVIKLFSLQLTVLCGLVGVVLYFTGVFQKVPLALYIFYAALGLSVLIAITFTFRRVFGLSKKGKSKDGVRNEKIEDREEKPSKTKKEERQAEIDSSAKNEITDENLQDEPKQAVYPKYYNVKQNGDYVMAEYEDRYELFVKEKDGLRKVRTDYKE